jgi:hypothetical protein
VERVGFGEVSPGDPGSVICTCAQNQRVVRGEQLAHGVLDFVVGSEPPAHEESEPVEFRANARHSSQTANEASLGPPSTPSGRQCEVQ